MYLFISATTPVSTTINTPVRTSVHSQNLRHVMTCEGNSLEIECPALSVINVMAAEYGHRTEKPTICESDFPNASQLPTCVVDSLSIVTKICEGMTSCMVCMQDPGVLCLVKLDLNPQS